MGVTPTAFAMLNTAIALVGRNGQTRMIELGNQHFMDNRIQHVTYNGCDHVVKHWVEAHGMEHVSIDLNGQDGALPIDLTQPVVGIEPADIVTNFGTIEHVGAEGQEQAFRNIVVLCKPGGIMLHLLPMEGHWPGHCDVRYSRDFLDYEGPWTHPLATWVDIACGDDRHQVAAVVKKRWTMGVPR